MMITSLEDFDNVLAFMVNKAVIAYNADYLKENLCDEALHLAGSELELPSSLNRIQDVRISFRLKQERKMLWLWLCLFII